MTEEIDRTVLALPMEEIFCDDDFNCRGKIMPLAVLDLAKDIAENGLDVPIVVQPYIHDKNPKHKYRIIAGHRRFMAFRINRATTIPASIRTGLNELQAAGMNLRENLSREDLNIKQEANGLRRFMMAGWNEQATADFLKQSRGWVQIRYMLLRLPEDIQNEAAAGMITQDQVRELAKHKGDKQYELVRQIKTAKLKGEKVSLKEKPERDILKQTKRSQERGVIFAMNEHLLMNIGACLVTRALAWAAGEISDYEFITDVKRDCESRGVFYEIPPAYLNKKE